MSLWGIINSLRDDLWTCSEIKLHIPGEELLCFNCFYTFSQTFWCTVATRSLRGNSSKMMSGREQSIERQNFSFLKSLGKSLFIAFRNCGTCQLRQSYFGFQRDCE